MQWYVTGMSMHLGNVRIISNFLRLGKVCTLEGHMKLHILVVNTHISNYSHASKSFFIKWKEFTQFLCATQDDGWLAIFTLQLFASIRFCCWRDLIVVGIFWWWLATGRRLVHHWWKNIFMECIYDIACVNKIEKVDMCWLWRMWFIIVNLSSHGRHISFD